MAGQSVRNPMIESLETRRLFSVPVITTTNVAVTEGKNSDATITIRLSSKSSKEVKVTYSTKNGTAVAGTDYTAERGTLVIAAGKKSGTIEIPILDESTADSTVKFYVDLTGAVHAKVSSEAYYSRVTITDTGSSGTTTSTGTGTTTTGSGTTTTTGTDLSDNLSGTSGGSETATGSTYLSASFTTTTATTLTQVTLLLDQVSSGTATVSIYTDSGSEPGTLVATLTSPSNYSSALASTIFSSSSGVSLTANTTYWVVLKASSGSYNWSFTSDDENSTSTGDGFTGVWGTSGDSGVTWYTDDDYPLQMSVTTSS